MASMCEPQDQVAREHTESAASRTFRLVRWSGQDCFSGGSVVEPRKAVRVAFPTCFEDILVIGVDTIE